uniref:Uncharacterized protein n=1 Tax=Anopheles atroparvus TaxID=41427 RepID=A0AAG5DMV7_ANOAO
MGLKLKWFRRRITFEGVMPAPERNIRQKEATSGTVVGVYRQSKNFEDYIEPARTSYWQPPPQAIARATYRSSNPTPTSTNRPSSSSSTARGTIFASRNSTTMPSVPAPTIIVPTTISSVSRPATASAAVVIGGVDTKDKIARAGGNGALRRDTPPEPTYTPPQPPVRKAKSVGSLTNVTSPTGAGRYPMDDGHSSEDSSSGYVTSYELRTPRSVEVLSAPSPPRTPTEHTPPRVPPVTPIPRTTSANALPLSNGPSNPRSRKLVYEEPDYIVPLASEQSDAEPIYDSFEAIFERVKVRQPASPSSSSPQRSAPVSPSTASPTPRQREPVLVVTSVPNPQMSPPQPKSILKKRAPPPPALVEATSAMVNPTESEPVMLVPTPPPRSTRGTPGGEVAEAFPEPPKAREEPSPRKERELQMVPQVPHAVEHGSEDDSDGDFNWDFVQRHRSSINQTVAAQAHIDPEVLRNAPASLRQGPAGALPNTIHQPAHEPIAQPRTLRGMRNQRAKPQEPARWNGAETPPARTPPARASDSNNSETSA